MTDTYGFLFRELLHPAWEGGLRRRPTYEHLAYLERTEWSSPDELHAIQSAELGKLLHHAWLHVPFYSRRFEHHGVEPRDILGPEDLAKLPLLTREDARASLAERSSTAEPLAEIRKMTGGTTGEPLRFAYDRGSEYWRNAVKVRGYGWAHYRPGDRSLHFWGDLALFHHIPLQKRAKTALDHAIRREHFVDSTDRSPEALSRVVELLRRTRPTTLCCYAQAGVALARHVLETGADVPQMSVICAAERLWPADRALLVRAFGNDVFETYGSREVMLIAAECDAHHGLHVSMENLIVELVVRDGSRERPAEPGEVGEVVVTDLHNFGAPFIRYVTGDLASALPRGRCACGRGLDRLEAVSGRVTETLKDGSGKPVSGLYFSVYFALMADTIRQFSAVQRRDGSVDLSIVPAPAFHAGVLVETRRKFEEFLPGVELRIHVVPAIPLGKNGKLALVTVEPR